MEKNNRILSIEGNIGSGKSTLLSNLKMHYEGNSSIIFVDEPVSEWETIVDPSDGHNMIQKFYKNQEKYSFPFQMMAYISRLALLKDAYEKNNNCIIITERSLFTDKHVFAQMLYDDGKIEDINYQIYKKWFDTFAKDFPIDKFIYVNTLPSNCFVRVTRRSRVGENNISLNYLQNCHKYHEEMMTNFKNIIQIDGNIDINENKSQMKDWIHFIDRNLITNTELPIIHVPKLESKSSNSDLNFNILKICNCDYDCDCDCDY